MERKLKIMGIYIGLLFFVSILLILITSLSNSKMTPTYQTVEKEIQQQVGFNSTMQDSVSKLTENNRKLNEKVKEQNSQIERLEKSLSEKDKIIENTYKEDKIKLIEVLKLYVAGSMEESQKLLETVNRENLTAEDQIVYDNLLEKLQ